MKNDESSLVGETLAKRVLELEEELAAVRLERDRQADLIRLMIRFDDEYTAYVLDGLDIIRYHSNQIDAILNRRDPDLVVLPLPEPLSLGTVRPAHSNCSLRPLTISSSATACPGPTRSPG